MNWGIFIPIAAIVMGPLAWILNTWIRARHGYPIESEAGEQITRDGLILSRQTELLAAESGQLKDRVHRLEDRLSVLERIATDPAERTAREIEQLR
jgi:ubiquinone biosynthesis protein UbiJ